MYCRNSDIIATNVTNKKNHWFAEMNNANIYSGVCVTEPLYKLSVSVTGLLSLQYIVVKILNWTCTLSSL